MSRKLEEKDTLISTLHERVRLLMSGAVLQLNVFNNEPIYQNLEQHSAPSQCKIVFLTQLEPSMNNILGTPSGRSRANSYRLESNAKDLMAKGLS